MTIRDIGILFGYKVDQASEQKVEGSIKSLKSMASKVLGAVGITLSVAGIKSAIDGCVEVASSIEEMQNKFDVVFGDMRNEAINGRRNTPMPLAAIKTTSRPTLPISRTCWSALA